MARATTTSWNVFESIAQLMHDRAVTATAVVHREMVKKVSTPGPPRSSPGNPPHVDTAQLRQSLQPDVVREGNTIRGSVSTNLEYAAYLEYGTSKMAPRPFLRPTMAEQRENVTRIMRGR